MTTAICIASGPSLTQEDVDFCKGKGKVYVVSDVHRIAPFADVLYSCDFQWWDHYKGVPEFAGEKWTIDQRAEAKYKINRINVLEKKPWSEEPGKIVTGGNSGFQCMNLAGVQGATRIILLGYDMQFGPDRKRHFFGEHPEQLTRSSNYKSWVEKFALAAPHIKAEVINCTRNSAIECFKKADIREVL